MSTRSVNILSALTRIDPSNTDWQFELAQALVEQAELARTRLERESVVAKTAEALRILEPLFTKQPGDRSMLLATVAAKLLKASAMGDASLLQLRLRLDLLQQVQSVTGDRDDPRLLALEVEALIATGKRAETAVAIRQLNDGGYREPQFVELLTHSGIDYPSNQLFADRLAVIMQDPRPSDAGLPPSHDTQTR